MQPNMVLPATRVYPCLLPSSSTLLPLLSHNKKPSKLYLYILKTHQLFIFRLIIHVLKLSWVFILLVLTIFDADADKQWQASTNDGGWVQTAANTNKVEYLSCWYWLYLMQMQINNGGRAQTMAGKYKRLWIRTRAGGWGNYNSSSSSICEHEQEQEGSNDGGQATVGECGQRWVGGTKVDG